MPSIDAYREMKTREKSRTVIQKKWSRSLTRGSKCSDLTGKMFMLCIGGRLLEVLAHGCLIEKSTILAMIDQNMIFSHRSFTDFHPEHNENVHTLELKCAPSKTLFTKRDSRIPWGVFQPSKIMHIIFTGSTPFTVLFCFILFSSQVNFI